MLFLNIPMMTTAQPRAFEWNGNARPTEAVMKDFEVGIFPVIDLVKEHEVLSTVIIGCFDMSSVRRG